MTLDQKLVRKFEDEIEESIASIVGRPEFSKLPLVPSQQTMHLMAKAAVAVYEAAVDNRDHVHPN